jgi:flagella basal body P-ring formation protein FlgA
MRLLALILALLQPALAECHLLHSGIIYGRDLASHVPGLEQLAPEGVIGLAPLPGVERWIRPAEQVSIGKRFGLTASPRESICLRIATRQLQAIDFELAVKPLLNAEAKIEIVDWSRFEVPYGELEFRTSGITYVPARDPNVPALWRGTLKYFGDRRITVWVKLRVKEARRWMEAARNIKAGETLTTGDVLSKTGDVFPFPDSPKESTVDFSGRRVRRSLAKGMPLREVDLQPKTDVERGDEVLVRVENASSVISVQARSEQAGALGQEISLRNPTSGRLFRARVEGKGTAVVRLGESR